MEWLEQYEYKMTSVSSLGIYNEIGQVGIGYAGALLAPLRGNMRVLSVRLPFIRHLPSPKMYIHSFRVKIRTKRPDILTS